MTQPSAPWSIPVRHLRPRMTLFRRVLALVLLTAIVASVAIGVYYRYVVRGSYDRFLREQIGTFIGLIVRDVGVPPDTSVAQRLSRTFPVDVRVERGNYSWSTDTSVSTPARIATETLPGGFDRGDTFLFRNFGDRFYAVVLKGEWTYVVRLRTAPTEDAVLPTIALVFVLLMLFTGAWYSVRRFLNPIKELMVGVEAVASENLDHTVPVSSSDELGDLTRAFNAMTQRVAAIIASKRRLLFDVSHELRSPLTRMNVAVAMLPEGKAKISIERNIRELNTMITELLENERLVVLGGTIVVEPVDVVSIARKVIDTFGYDQRRIEFDTLTESLMITADSQRLTVAIRNVISNGLKYSAQTEGHVKVTVFPDDDGARVVIADEGIGISAEQQERVFEPFYRTDDSRSRETGGYGLGLSLTKAIVDAHGGNIKLESTPGVGTTIMLWLPCEPTGSNVRAVASDEGRAS